MHLTTFFFCLFLFVAAVDKPFFFYPRPGLDPTNKPYDIFFNNTFPTDIELLSKYSLENFSYEGFLDKSVGVPMYAGLDLLKNTRVMMESFFTHFRARDSITRSNFSDQVCRPPGNSTTIIPGPRRILSVFHELNLPFEVECLTCDMKTVRELSPKFFRILGNR
ncbi:hypothetical protein FO519_008805 [Halicephalobus sp. NKZ332]|nr:hypothetical protein FO519_008805 [Halicephalobus sp. NKZ332]